MLLKAHAVRWRDEGHCQRQRCAERETGGRSEGSLPSMVLTVPKYRSAGKPPETVVLTITRFKNDKKMSVFVVFKSKYKINKFYKIL